MSISDHLLEEPAKLELGRSRAPSNSQIAIKKSDTCNFYVLEHKDSFELVIADAVDGKLDKIIDKISAIRWFFDVQQQSKQMRMILQIVMKTGKSKAFYLQPVPVPGQQEKGYKMSPLAAVGRMLKAGMATINVLYAGAQANIAAKAISSRLHIDHVHQSVDFCCDDDLMTLDRYINKYIYELDRWHNRQFILEKEAEDLP